MLMTASALRAQFGVGPADYLRMRSMTGDKSDNLPSVAYGVGHKIAVKYMRGELAVGSKMRRTITSPDAQAAMRLNQRLMCLPHPRTPEYRVWERKRFLLDNFLEICNRYGFQHFLKLENLNDWRQLFAME